MALQYNTLDRRAVLLNLSDIVHYTAVRTY